MPKFEVMLMYYANETVYVEAATKEEAAEKAYNEAQASLCHQCSDDLYLEDPYKAIVFDKDGNEIYTDNPDD